MKNLITLLSAYLVLFIVTGSCPFLGHHNRAEQNHHQHHANHSSEEHSEHKDCEAKCSCHEVVNLLCHTEIFTDFIPVPNWNAEQVARKDLLPETISYALARDGPIFEDGHIFARIIVMRT